MSSYTILVVEDEREIQKAIGSFLTHEGYTVLAASSGEEALELFEKHQVHFVVLDVMLPKMGGAETLSLIRKQSDVPVIVISALRDEAIQADLFAGKADDYVVKPFSLQVLAYKISALLRRTYSDKPTTITWRDVVLDSNNYQAAKAGRAIALTPKEFEILQVLMTNQGKVYSRETLLSLVWGYGHHGELRNIDVHVNSIRKKISPDIIKTVNRVGYMVETP